jgi:hypothetical protein
MPKAKLPETLREKIKELYRQGYERNEVFRLVKTEGLVHVDTEEELWRCLRSLKGKAPGELTPPPTPPKSKEFDTKPFRSILKRLRENMPGKELETACRDIARRVLQKHEGFEKVEDGPSFRGTPFDLFGLKGGEPYAIELKSSLDHFNHPGETQKWRLQELWKRVRGLHIALLQLAVRKGEYRIFYDDQLNILFFGPKAPLDPIERWVRERI